MEQKKRRQKNTFRNLERMLERIIIGTLVLFLLMLVAAATGIGWLKWILGLTVVLVSAMGAGHPHQSEPRFRRAEVLTASPSREKPLGEMEKGPLRLQRSIF